MHHEKEKKSKSSAIPLKFLCPEKIDIKSFSSTKV